MTADPVAPGRGLPVYQPATAVLAGTCSEPDAVRPSLMSRVRTPIAGISRDRGVATGLGVAAGAAAQCPFGIGTSGVAPSGVAGLAVWLAQASPAAAAQTTATPRTAVSAAHGRRISRAAEACLPLARLQRCGVVESSAGMQGGPASPAEPDNADHRPGQAGQACCRPWQQRSARTRGGTTQAGRHRADRGHLAARGIEQVVDRQLVPFVQHDQRVDRAGAQGDRYGRLLARAFDLDQPGAGPDYLEARHAGELEVGG